MKHNGGSIAVPKHVSFVQQAKDSGTHVWYMSTGQAKDSNVYYIIILKNGKPGLTVLTMTIPPSVRFSK